VGGLALAGGQFGRLSIAGACVMFTGAMIVAGVELSRTRAPATTT
jgi:hypothetical protein